MDLLYDLLPPVISHPSALDPEDDSRLLSKGFPHSLVLSNDASTARDHLANERTFLSWLRLSCTLSIVSLAIIISFHLRVQPSVLEQRMALPLGIVFFILSVLSLAGGTANYAKTTHGYATRKPIVETGTKTSCIFGFISLAIVMSCVVFIATGATTNSTGSESSKSTTAILSSNIANSFGYLAPQT